MVSKRLLIGTMRIIRGMPEGQPAACGRLRLGAKTFRRCRASYRKDNSTPRSMTGPLASTRHRCSGRTGRAAVKVPVVTIAPAGSPSNPGKPTSHVIASNGPPEHSHRRHGRRLFRRWPTPPLLRPGLVRRHPPARSVGRGRGRGCRPASATASAGVIAQPGSGIEQSRTREPPIRSRHRCRGHQSWRSDQR